MHVGKLARNVWHYCFGQDKLHMLFLITITVHSVMIILLFQTIIFYVPYIVCCATSKKTLIAILQCVLKWLFVHFNDALFFVFM